MKPTPCLLKLAGCLVMLATLVPAVAQDKTVLGFELGSRYSAAACNPGETAFPSRPCYDGSLTKRQPAGADEYFVFIPLAATPPYVRGDIRVTVLDGIVESVLIGTWGIQAQDLALAAFTKKYGAPTRARQERQKALRSRIPTQFAEWDLRDFSVKLEGSTGSIDWGRIEMSTHRYRKMVEDYEKRVPLKSSKTPR